MMDAGDHAEPRLRYRHGAMGRGWRHAAEHDVRCREMESWCRANLAEGTWDRLDVPAINGQEGMVVFGFDREEDRVLFAMVMG
jgi:hypothetical protein